MTYDYLNVTQRNILVLFLSNGMPITLELRYLYRILHETHVEQGCLAPGEIAFGQWDPAPDMDVSGCSIFDS